MQRYLVKRITEMIPILFVVSIVIFFFIHLIPGDPARLVAGIKASNEEVMKIRAELGLDQPLWEQYAVYMGDLFRGELGTSLVSGHPVSEMVMDRLKPSFYLAVASMAWALVIGILIGMISAVFKNKWPDHLGMVTAAIGLAVPNFWLGLLCIQFISVQLGWFPSGGIESWRSYVLPSFANGLGIMAILARFTRSSLLETLNADYIRTARAKGLKESVLISKHALRNSLIPVITIAGLEFGTLLGLSVVVEKVFVIPGVGMLLLDSIVMRDYPVVQALLLLFAVFFIVINLVVDILYSILNPKIRYDS